MITPDEDINVAQTEWAAARAKAVRFGIAYTFIGVALIATMSVPSLYLANVFSDSHGGRYVLTPVFLTCILAPFVTFLSFFSLKRQAQTHELAQQLEERLLFAVKTAESESSRHEAQMRRQEFESRLSNALELADGETEVIGVVERAFGILLPSLSVEMLLADNSHAHLDRMAVWSPTGDPSHCGVDSPDQCPAARRSQTQRFTDSDALDVCPKLRGRPHGRVSAVCVPVSIMGRAVGVIHAVDQPNVAMTQESVQDLGILANVVGARIGLLRVIAETQLQAETDSLTGLLNRRSLANKVRALRNDKIGFSVVMADLDHFKKLNDTYGHETGDRALCLFSTTLTKTFRAYDLVSRHGGEEFAIVLPNCKPIAALAALTHLRERVAAELSNAGLPQFTASFGVVEAGEDEDLVTVIARADAALLEAKRAGRDQIIVHNFYGRKIDPALELAATLGESKPRATTGVARRGAEVETTAPPIEATTDAADVVTDSAPAPAT